MSQTPPMTTGSQTQNNTEQTSGPNKKPRAPLKWWVGTVVLTLFPSLVIALMALFRNKEITLELLIGDGELVLSSFLIIVSTLISYHNIQRKNSDSIDGLYFILLFGAFLELIAYTSFKTNLENENNLLTIGLTSAFSLAASIFVSWLWSKIMEGGESP